MAIKEMLKKASIRSDMANRAMFGVLSLFFTEETKNDLIVIDKVVQSVKDLINYGSRMCLQEARHSEVFDDYLNEDYYDSKDKMFSKKFNKDNASEFIDYLDRLSELFLDPSWDEGYGGRAWSRICVGLKTVASLYLEYSNSKTEKEKIDLGMKTIYSANLLDNLAHNTTSIFQKVLDQEDQDLSIEEGFSSLQEMKKVQSLMDSKNFKNPFDALIIAEKNLDMQLPYEEKYLSKLRGRKEYAEAKGKDNELETIKIRDSKGDFVRIQRKLDALLSSYSVIEKLMVEYEDIAILDDITMRDSVTLGNASDDVLSLMRQNLSAAQYRFNFIVEEYPAYAKQFAECFNIMKILQREIADVNRARGQVLDYFKPYGMHIEETPELLEEFKEIVSNLSTELYKIVELYNDSIDDITFCYKLALQLVQI